MTNNQIYIIEDKHNSLSKNLKIEGIEYTPDLITDSKIDDWVRNTLFRLNNDIEKIIIPIRLGFEDTEYIGLRIGLHIRLTKSLNEKRFVPIIFTGTETDCEIINNQLKNKQLLTSLILFTPGTKLVDLFDLDLNSFPDKLNENIFKTEVLPKLIITNERGSGHQLSNEWGAFRLAKSAQIELKTLEIPTDLYFKFKFANTDFIIDTKSINKMADRSKNFNFLIIDDNADKGWTELLNHIIGSELINKFTNKIKSTEILDFEGASNYCDFEAHDLIFLDLRLKKEEEFIQNDSINELSGVQILKKIKEINRGIQVIIITASNKAWNMKKLLDEGADAYFIKESMDISITEEISKQNYNNLVENIKSLFERIYLRDLFTKIKGLNDKLESSKNDADKSYVNFIEEIKLLLEQSYDMHYNAKTEKQFAYAYITLYMIIERVNKELISKNTYQEGVKTEFYLDSIKLEKWDYNVKNKSYEIDKKAFTKDPTETQKIITILKQKFKCEDNIKIHSFESLIKMRNHFIHNDDRLIKDIFSKKGYMELFEVVNLITSFL
jgi:CheY-like chemotaxis protein